MKQYQEDTPSQHPPYLYPPYASTIRRSPRLPFVKLWHTVSETTGPSFGEKNLAGVGNDLTRDGAGGMALGQRIIISGRVTDSWGRPISRNLVEIWQANAAGRYMHESDRSNAPLDPNFSGRGATLTDDDGFYRFVTIEPGSYPWRNHYNAWRPRHVHFSLFGPAFATRLVTQMYFPGDPLLPLDPIFNSIPDEGARRRLISKLDMESAIPDISLAYRFDLVLRGRNDTPTDPGVK